MKPERLTIRNIGMIESEEIEIDKSLILFFGDILQGKTTILNSIKLLFGGSFPDDLITHGKDAGFVELKFDSGIISRGFYRNKKGQTVARPIEFVRDNKTVKKPVEAIKELINPFLIDQNFLVSKNGIDRQKYFIDLFGIDTIDLDNELNDSENESRNLRSEIKGYGEIKITKVDKPDFHLLLAEKSKIEAEDQKIIAVEIKKRETFNDEQTQRMIAINNTEHDLDSYTTALVATNSILNALAETLRDITENINREKRNKIEFETLKKTVKEKLANLPKPQSQFNMDTTNITTRGTSKIDGKISNAKADEILYNQYLIDTERQEEKSKKIATLKDNETRQRKIKGEKATLLSGKAENTGIPDFSFDSEGCARFQDTAMDMLSTSQLMLLSSMLSGMYPKGLGIELIDRAESLGNSIYSYVTKATAENRTILATIVGDKPATVPEEIGVFVVKGGKIK